MSREKQNKVGNVVWAVLPARYDSTRFPGKALARIAGKPMIQHVHDRVGRTKGVSRVLVATDDERIIEAVRGFGGEAILTGTHHQTGTDRIAQAVEETPDRQNPPDWILNVQGDEPLIEPSDLDTLIEGMAHIPEGVLGTLVFPIQEESELQDPNIVKAVLDQNMRALYFSRATVPFPRGSGELGWRHLGVYLFRAEFLKVFSRLPATPLSTRERLEQLRALEHGYPIHCFRAANPSVGVDVPEDLPRAEALLSSQGVN